MVTPESPPYSPSEKWSIIEEGDLPELDKEFTKSLKALGKTDAQIAHVNDEGTWEVGKLHKYKSKEISAPTGAAPSARATCTSSRTPLATSSFACA